MHILSMAPRKLNQQALYLAPDKAKLLDQLSSETRIPKAVLLREAVDDLLTKHGKANNQWYSEIAGALRMGKAISNRYSSMSNEQVWLAKCEEFRRIADEILVVLGKR
jgi:hypothetical protein